MHEPTLVVVDDDEPARALFEEICSHEGYQVVTVPDGPAGLRTVKDIPVQAVVTDLRLPGMDGLEFMERIAQIDPRIVTIVITGQDTVDDAVRAMNAGAFDFITKPYQTEAVRVIIRKAMEYQRLRQENHLLRRAVRDQYGPDQLIGTSGRMRSVLDFIAKVADSNGPILIQGESGTGKEMVARMLHFNSARRDRPLVPVNCGAIPETLLESELFGHEKGAYTGATHARTGRFELAHGGTIFLDEVAELPLRVQVKLLRMLEGLSFERVGGTRTISVDVRVIAAANQNLDQAVKAGRFRSDLYERLNVIPVTLPPLRERRNDIPLLTDHFIRRFNATKPAAIRGVDPEAMGHLMRYDWPGNVRELENLVERTVVLKRLGTIETTDLPEKVLQAVNATPSWPLLKPPELTAGGINLVHELEQFENHLIRVALRQANGVTSRAAQLLHLNRTTLVEKLKRKKLEARLLSGEPSET